MLEQPINLSVELDQSSRTYGHIHVTGCRDLKDPERLGPCYSLDDAGVLVSEVTGWECDDKYDAIANCVKQAFRSAKKLS